MTAIGNYAFLNASFSSVTIPAGVTHIGSSAFYNCTKLTSLTYLGSEEPDIGYGAFQDVSADMKVSVTSDYIGETFAGYSVTRTDGDAEHAHRWRNL